MIRVDMEGEIWYNWVNRERIDVGAFFVGHIGIEMDGKRGRSAISDLMDVKAGKAFK